MNRGEHHQRFPRCHGPAFHQSGVQQSHLRERRADLGLAQSSEEHWGRSSEHSDPWIVWRTGGSELAQRCVDLVVVVVAGRLGPSAVDMLGWQRRRRIVLAAVAAGIAAAGIAADWDSRHSSLRDLVGSRHHMHHIAHQLDRVGSRLAGVDRKSRIGGVGRSSANRSHLAVDHRIVVAGDTPEDCCSCRCILLGCSPVASTARPGCMDQTS